MSRDFVAIAVLFQPNAHKNGIATTAFDVPPRAGRASSATHTLPTIHGATS